MSSDIIVVIVIVVILIVVFLGKPILNFLFKKENKNAEKKYLKFTEPSPPPAPPIKPQPISTKPPPPHKPKPAAPKAAPKSLEKIKALLEQGMYEEALDVTGTHEPAKIKSKIIAMRDDVPEISALLVEAEEALIKNRAQYDQNCKLRDSILQDVQQKWGELALELFSGAQLWRIIKVKHQIGKDVSTYAIEEIQHMVEHLPPLEMSKGRKVYGMTFRTNCSVCNGGKNVPSCPTCNGSGFIKPYLRDGIHADCPLCNGSGRIGTSLLVLLSGKTQYTLDELKTVGGLAKYDKGYSEKVECPVCKGTGYTEPHNTPCTTCNGSGKYCQCRKEVTFVIPYEAWAGMIIKAEESTRKNPVFARLVP
jgi:hypothetical protein